MDLRKGINESELQFLWRLGSAKESGALDLSWQDIANIMNKECRDNDVVYGESRYRKMFQSGQRFVDEGIFNNNDQSYLEDLREAKHELQKEKQKLFDERVALNKILRENARTEQDLAILKAMIQERSVIALPKAQNDSYESGNDLFVPLSDFHLGSCSDNHFGKYDSDIAAVELSNYLQKILEIREIYRSENVYLGLLGDLLSGEIHFTVQLENRESVIEQVQKSAELISVFTYELSKHFKNVYVNGVAGNHSRTSFKDQVLRGNRLDNLIPWYMKAKLEHIDNVHFIDGENYDSTIAKCSIRGNEYIMVHGDYDSYSESGISKLVMMLGFKPMGIFYGHLHRCSYDDIAGVKIIRSGSFSGTSDDYAISKRLSGKPSQMVCVIDSNGIRACCPVPLR